MAINQNFCSNIVNRSLTILFGGLSLLAQAGPQEDIAKIQSKLRSMTPHIKAKSIKTSPISGLYELFVGGSLIYTDKNYDYVIVNGSIIDIKSKKNKTEESLKQLTSIKFNELPFQNAIEIKKGSGAYKFVIFSDPDCPYCKSLEIGLAESNLTDYTAYIFLYPLKAIHPDAASKSESIWCSKNKGEAWSSFMVIGTTPEKVNCDNPLNENEKLAEEIGISGTPTIYLNNGQQTQNLQELVEAINAYNKTN